MKSLNLISFLFFIFRRFGGQNLGRELHRKLESYLQQNNFRVQSESNFQAVSKVLYV